MQFLVVCDENHVRQIERKWSIKNLTPQKRENNKTFVEIRQIDSEMVATTTTPVIFSIKRSHQIVTKKIIMQF